MNETKIQFRTAAFGGFQKQDVLAYLEQSAKDQAEKLEELRRKLEEEKSGRTEAEENLVILEKRVSGLAEENQRLAEELAQRETALAEMERSRKALAVRAEQLEEQVKKLAPAASAYEGIKERTAGIELEAHSRALAIEGEAKRKVKKTVGQADEWLKTVQGSYARLRADMEATLTRASEEMKRAEQGFANISDQLADHDEALKALREQIKAMERPQPPQPLPVEDEET